MYDSMWYRGSRGEDENNRRMTGAAVARSVRNDQLGFRLHVYICWHLTLAVEAPPKDTRAGDDHIVDDGEYTLTSNPTTMLVLNLTVIEHGGFV